MAELTHFDEHGASRMVDTSEKAQSLRQARASGSIHMAAATARLIRVPGAFRLTCCPGHYFFTGEVEASTDA